ncbi:Methylmalonyl-CoA epimerase, mitochondrial [Balamuthia mandrillaris]
MKRSVGVMAMARLPRRPMTSTTTYLKCVTALHQRQRMLSSVATEAANALKIGRLNHVAIAVPDLKQSSSLYRDILGAKVSSPVDQVEHGVTTVFVELGNTKIELLHPLGEQSPIANFLSKKPSGGIHHICLEVDNIDTALKTLQSKGIKVIDPKPKIGAHGKPVVFVHPKDMNGVLVELEEA